MLRLKGRFAGFGHKLRCVDEGGVWRDVHGYSIIAVEKIIGI